jgi:L-arabonate dehydrase
MAPAGSSAIPAMDSRRIAMTRDVGEYILNAVADDLRPSQIMTTSAFRNAVRALAAIDGAANAVIHLLAIAGRLDVDFALADFDRLSADTPVLLNLRPSGKFYYNDFFNAGGVPALLNAMGELIDRETLTVTGRTLGAEIADATIEDGRVIGTIDNPIAPPRGIAVLHGNLAPDGAILRTGVASPDLLTHRGRAVVFQSKEEQDELLYRPDFDIRPGDVVVVLNGGPKGSAGMPEYGRIQVPEKLLAQGITDMVRVTDGRVGGTVSGTAILQITPEAAVGGPVGLLETGDTIVLDLPNRRIDVELTDDELAQRRARRAAQRSSPGPLRGFAKLYVDSVTQADSGCDFDFLQRVPTATTEEPR